MHGSRPKGIPRQLSRTPLAAAILLVCPAAMAQTALDEVIVTAQKRSENLQDVPISIQSLNNEALTELGIKKFDDYVRMIPSVAAQPTLGSGAGSSQVYMRGVASGGDGQATTSQPSVGMYLDEQPLTTIGGNVDVHMYDIARVEALAGPQGTLYGASSQSGTIRIITNKPDASAFDAGYSLEGNIVDGDDSGYMLEGFVNLPISDTAAIRLVGWYRSDAGWIDNNLATRTYPGAQSDLTDDITVDNAEFVKDNYNTVETMGGRAALRIELGDNWVVTPAVSGQAQDSKGSFGDDLSEYVTGGSHDVAHFSKEFASDEWYQAGLTIEGKIGNFDLVYSGNYLTRNYDQSIDYADYAFFYDNLYTTGYFAGLFFNNAGERIDPSASFTNEDTYTKTSHELRITTPQENRVRGLLGFFYQKQYHDFYQEFGKIKGLADVMLMNANEPGSQRFPGVVYLNSFDRYDTDQAVFGQIQFDITDRLELSLGLRYFEPEVTVKGFFGFGLGFNPARVPGTGASDGTEEPGDPNNGGAGTFSPVGQGWSRNGEWRCPSQEDWKDTPCQNVNKGISESDYVGRVNLSFKASDAHLLYATWSEGYRPGGINRNPFAGDYVSDFLTNWELGWKAQFLDNRMQLNSAVFYEEWDKFQTSFQGANGITQVGNGPTAEILGTEVQLLWAVSDNFRLSGAVAYYDSKLKNDYADFDSDGNVVGVQAPKGTRLPLTPEFKGNLVARYGFPLSSFDAYVQGAVVYVGDRSILLNVADNAIAGNAQASTTIDLSTGIHKNAYSVDLFISNVTNEDSFSYLTSECAPGVCGVQSYGVRPQPRTIGIKFTQDF